MNSPADRTLQSRETHSRTLLVVLIALLVASSLNYLAIAILSRQFSWSVPGHQRPIPTMLLMFATAFGCFFLSLFVSLKLPDDRSLLAALFGGSVLFRAILVPSVPIQEIDIYRYLWDGEVAARGISPYRYPPGQVLAAAAVPPAAIAGDPQLAALAELPRRDPSLHVVLQRIHYEHLPTIYPPVSQAVFATAALVTAEPAAVEDPAVSVSSPRIGERVVGPTPQQLRKRVALRVTVMKSFLVLFDLATFGLVVYLLRLVGWHRGWSLVYGWCPLVLKEIAGSGHLDSIAIFLSVLTLTIAAAGMRRAAGRAAATGRTSVPYQAIVAASLMLALAVGAKLYPVVLAPLLVVTLIRYYGWWPALLAAVLCGALCSLLLWPMLYDDATPSDAPPTPSPTTALPAVPETVELPPPPDALELPPEIEPQADTAPQEAVALGATPAPADGLRTFLNRWEMNDLTFMFLYENLRPPPQEARRGRPPWFVVVPSSWARPLVNGFAHMLRLEGAGSHAAATTAAFRLTRYVTLFVWLLIATLLAWRATGPQHQGALDVWLRTAFLSIAWFWLLAPTQNPWYWCWAIPLLPFARGRAWLAVAPLTMLYYTRFWFRDVFGGMAVLGTPYFGEDFFHFVVIWIEFAPWFLVLAIETVWCRRRAVASRRSRAIPPKSTSL